MAGLPWPTEIDSRRPRSTSRSSQRRGIFSFVHYPIDREVALTDPKAVERLDEYPHGAAALQDIIDAAVTNANQHGEAAHVSINITCERYVDGTAFTVTVDDDGIGPPYAVTPGMGLSGIDAWGGTWALA